VILTIYPSDVKAGGSGLIIEICAFRVAFKIWMSGLLGFSDLSGLFGSFGMLGLVSLFGFFNLFSFI
jgi:hypothetical protein